MIIRLLVVCLIGIAAFVLQPKPAFAQDKDYEGFNEVVVEKYGYKMMIPKEFELNGKIDKTSGWSYMPGAAEMLAKAKAEKVPGIGGALKESAGLDGAKTEQAPSSGAGSGGALESVLFIAVNRMPMPDLSSQFLYDLQLKGFKESITSPNPKGKDIQMFDKKKGYKWEGLAFWYKEVDKASNEQDKRHHWNIMAYGNKSIYNVILSGDYKQFEKWGPIYEKVIKSFELIAIKE